MLHAKCSSFMVSSSLVSVNFKPWVGVLVDNEGRRIQPIGLPNKREVVPGSRLQIGDPQNQRHSEEVQHTRIITVTVLRLVPVVDYLTNQNKPSEFWQKMHGY